MNICFYNNLTTVGFNLACKIVAILLHVICFQSRYILLVELFVH